MIHIQTDVLIIGAGAAGLRAAVAAAEAGARVTVVAKLASPRGTSTLLSAGAFTGHPGGLSRAEHRALTVAAGRGLNQADLIEVFIAEAPHRLEELVEWGMKAAAQGGHLVAQGRPLAYGEEIIRALALRAKGLGVEFLSGLTAWRLDLSSGRPAALAYSFRGEWLTLTAGAVILATGGASGLYRRHDNPARMVGEGYALGLLAGARLQDMEFQQFFPLVLAEPGLPRFLVIPPLELLAKFYNHRGESIHAKYGLTELPASAKARDKLSQALFREIEVDGGHVVLDFRGVDPAAWQAQTFTARLFEPLVKRGRALERPLKVAPAAHFTMGGLSITPDGATTLPGLWACGEVAGGVQGANRLGGNALTETIVFGARAGEAAAKWVKANPAVGQIPDLAGFIPPSGPERDGRLAGELKARLKEIMWQWVGILRDQAGLARAGRELALLRAEAEGLGLPAEPKLTQEVLELRLGVQTAEVMAQAALRRTESRGAHFRTDYPAPDEARWHCRNLVQLDQEGRAAWSLGPA
jgi:succinate dehydrogenase/fumarate reductase flavoprotein subunit